MRFEMEIIKYEDVARIVEEIHQKLDDFEITKSFPYVKNVIDAYRWVKNYRIKLFLTRIIHKKRQGII